MLKAGDRVRIKSPCHPPGSTGVVRFCVEPTSATVCVDGATLVYAIPQAYLERIP